MTKLILQNYITSAFGAVILITLLISIAQKVLNGETIDTDYIETIVTQIAAGLALLFARDSNKSSRKTGVL